MNSKVKGSQKKTKKEGKNSEFYMAHSINKWQNYWKG